jgi:hypothetical protein
MSTGPAHDRVGPADLEYDLAHEAATAPLGVPLQRRPTSRGGPGSRTPTASTPTPDAASDYGYDLAHDVPEAHRR